MHAFALPHCYIYGGYIVVANHILIDIVSLIRCGGAGSAAAGARTAKTCALRHQLYQACKVDSLDMMVTSVEEENITADERKMIPIKSVGRSENHGVPVLLGGLNDLPKFGGAPSAPPG